MLLQPSLSQMASLTPGAGGANLLHELMGFLRRSLTQHAAIREALYQVSMSLLPVTCKLTYEAQTPGLCMSCMQGANLLHTLMALGCY